MFLTGAEREALHHRSDQGGGAVHLHKRSSFNCTQANLLCLCKYVVLHVLRHDVFRQRLQFGGQKLDRPLPHDVLTLQDLREEASESTWVSKHRQTSSRHCAARSKLTVASHTILTSRSDGGDALKTQTHRRKSVTSGCDGRVTHGHVGQHVQ